VESLSSVFFDSWFPEKAIRLWTELHLYEDMGLVMEYQCNTGDLIGLTTDFYQDRFRPVDDRYFPRKLLSDPVFIVQGTRKDEASIFIVQTTRKLS
jgi:hypothetical protein